jgi:hypothetical protein
VPPRGSNDGRGEDREQEPAGVEAGDVPPPDEEDEGDDGRRLGHYDLELMRQTGRLRALVGGTVSDWLRHDASFLHLDVGYSFDHALAPALSLLFDRASGDRHPADGLNERFDTLYGARRFDFGPTGIYGPFARANLATPGMRLSLRPPGSWQARFTWRSFRLASARDAWTTTGLRDSIGSSGTALGRQFEMQAAWQPPIERLSFEFGAAWLRKGWFIQQTAPELAASSTYVYAAMTVEFLNR